MTYEVKVKEFFYQLSTSLISSDKKKVKWTNMPLMCVENYYKLGWIVYCTNILFTNLVGIWSSIECKGSNQVKIAENFSCWPKILADALKLHPMLAVDFISLYIWYGPFVNLVDICLVSYCMLCANIVQFAESCCFIEILMPKFTKMT